MDIVTLGAALNGSAEYVNSHFKGGSNIQIVNNPDGTQTINASGEVSSEDTVARAEIAAIKDGTNIDSFGDVESALGNKADSSTTYTKTEVDTALGGKVDKETGKGLSTNDYTDTEKAKLAGIEAQANKTTVDDSLSGSSTNPVQNKVVKTALDGKANASTTYTKTEVDTALSGKQATLTTAQLVAANSGITSADVAQITTNKNNISSIKEKTDNIIIDSNRNIYIQATAPTGTIPVGSTWISGGSLKGYVQESNVSTATIEQGTFNADGSESPNKNRVRTTFDTDIYSMGAYTVSITGANDVLVFVYDSDKTCIQSEGSNGWKSLPYSFNLAGDRYVKFAFRKTYDAAISPSDVSNYALAFQGWK